MAGKILVTSPLAQGLLGKKIGQRVDIEVPRGSPDSNLTSLDDNGAES